MPVRRHMQDEQNIDKNIQISAGKFVESDHSKEGQLTKRVNAYI